LSSTYRTVVVTPERYSQYRLRTLGSDLELDLSAVRLEPAAQLSAYGDCDLFVAIGNEVLPSIPGIGQRRIYICQFPFPMHAMYAASAWDTLHTYDTVLVYSDYAARHIAESAASLGEELGNVVVLPPPVPQIISSPGRRIPGRILHVGRFAPEGHAKRQDILLEAFRALVKGHGVGDLELHFVGTISPDANSRRLFMEMRSASRGLPVYFHVNASAGVVAELYATSSFYWHATGYAQNERYNPQRFEHFGISVVEAMSTGAIPFVYDAAGPAEIVVHGTNGFQWHTISELVELTAGALTWDSGKLNLMRLAAMHTARQYDASIFRTRLGAIIAGSQSRVLNNGKAQTEAGILHHMSSV
jgi:glycosyltransferase involved in cell wall biosynthesis